MAKLVLRIPDNKYADVIAAFRSAFGAGPEGETDELHFRRKVVEYINGVVRERSITNAMNAAREVEIARPAISIEAGDT